jgi:hypothetical protein
MSEPIIERLSRFTPDVGGLDRDALLFAAGRAAARPNRAWIALAGALAGTQMLTLALWWSQPTPRTASIPPAAPVPSQSEPAPPESSESPQLWSNRRNLLESEPDDRLSPGETGIFVDSRPPLRAFGAPPPSILN